MPREIVPVALRQPSVRFSNGTVIELEALAGVATQWSGGGRGLRSPMLPAERDVSVEFDAALDELGILVQETVEVDVTSVGSAARSMRASGSRADRVVIRPAASGRDGVQVVWYQDESGGVTWHFPDGFLDRTSPRNGAAATRDSVRRASKRAVFTILARTPAARAWGVSQPASRLRGPITKLGRKVFKILLVPLARLIERPLETIVGKIEKKHRQEVVRGVTADDYRQPASEPFTRWSGLDGKRSLLFVHGIFSTTQGMLSGFPKPVMEQLAEHYSGRVIALDQRTVASSPEDNARTFLETLKRARPGGQFEFDVLCHSRGGIVARTMAERGNQIVPGNPCSFRKIFFVASPNAGSPLGDARHIVDMLDVFTNCLTNFPDGPVLYSLEIILSIVKLVAYAGGTRLPGIADMGTSGYIPSVLNASTSKSPADYAAASANYEPRSSDNAFFKGRVADSVIDRVFESLPNDLVVPRDGVFAANGHPSFPLADPLVYEESDHVWHTDFFTRPRTIGRIFRHFEIPKGLGVPVTGLPRSSTSNRGGSVRMDRPSVPSVPEMLDDLLNEVAPSMHFDSLPSGDAEAGRRGDASDGATLRRPATTVRKAKIGKAAARKPAAKKAPPKKSARPLGDEVVRRKPEIQFHEQVKEGESNELLVRLSDLVTAGAPTVAIDFAVDEASVDVLVRLHAPGFDVAPQPTGTMVVRRPRDPKSEEVTFQLTARSPGNTPQRREISAEFWLRNSMIGAVTHYTFVLPKGTVSGPSDGSSRSEGFVIPPVRRNGCDLIVMVEGRDELGQSPFRLRLRSEVPGEEYASLDCGLFNLPQNDLGSFVHSAIDGLIGTYPDSAGNTGSASAAKLEAWNDEFLARLNALGKQLWTLLPPAFRKEYFRLCQTEGALRSILVHSDEMLFPWELVVPNELIGNRFVELAPLGIQHVLGRWKPGLRMKPSPQRMSVPRFVVLNPVYLPPDDLPWAELEIQALRKLFPSVEVYKPSTAARIRQDLLQRNDVRLLHFSGHGQFDSINADLSHLLLEDGSAFDALSMGRTRLGMEGSPVVYLNACSVGSSGITVGRAGGFAAACLDGGFSGVIAPYWPVNDHRAAEFATELYQKLLGGRSIGESLRELRDKGRDDPTYLAFAYFGDPWTCMNFDALLPAVAALAPGTLRLRTRQGSGPPP